MLKLNLEQLAKLLLLTLTLKNERNVEASGEACGKHDNGSDVTDSEICNCNDF